MKIEKSYQELKTKLTITFILNLSDINEGFMINSNVPKKGWLCSYTV